MESRWFFSNNFGKNQWNSAISFFSFRLRFPLSGMLCWILETISSSTVLSLIMKYFSYHLIVLNQVIVDCAILQLSLDCSGSSNCKKNVFLLYLNQANVLRKTRRTKPKEKTCNGIQDCLYIFHTLHSCT